MERYMRGFDLAPELTPYCHNTPQNSEHTSGAMDDSSGKGSKVQAHIISGVVMDSTAFKVSHCVGCDINATALPAARARSVSIGAMAESSGQVQNASAHGSLRTGKEQSKSSGGMQASTAASLFNGASSRARVQGHWKKSPEMVKAHVFKNARAHRINASRDIQPNQPCRPTRLDIEDPAPTICIEHHTTGHLRLDGHGTIDADCRTGAHVSRKAVRARRDQYLVDGAVVDGIDELRHGAHRDFVQMPAVQHEGRHIGRGDGS